MARRQKPHRGVVLLVVLTLLTLLIVIGLTFAALSGQFRRTAEAGARKERYERDPAEVLDKAVYQLVRDTTADSRSSLQRHSLLADLLGNDGAAGVVLSYSQEVGGEFLSINFSELPLAAQPFGKRFNSQAGYYNGCTLTILGPVFTAGVDGQPGRAGFDDDGANGTDDLGELGWPGTDDRSLIADSARVVRYNFDSSTVPGTGTFMVEWSAGEGGMIGFPRPGTRLLVNGRPLNGTGAGYLNRDPYTLDATTPVAGRDFEVALLPNYRAYSLPANNPADLGGLDETWDAVDYQNMFLAMVPADVSAGIIPSFHRPELVNYWIKRLGAEVLAPAGVTRVDLQVQAFRYPFGSDGVPGVNPYTGINDDAQDDAGDPINTDILREIVRLKRMIILRPLPDDHPNFVNNIRFVSTMGLPDQRPGVDQTLPQMVWDIDNDGDGIPDSVWIDIGLPIQTDDSGRRFRPLVAILCQDLDGRLNVNAHSSPAHNSSLYADMTGWPAGVALQPSPANGTTAPFASVPLAPPQAVLLPRGLGVGPADIFLGHLLGPDDFRNVLTERYRHDVTVTGNAGGISNIDDWMSQIKNLGLPRDYSNQFSAYGSPPDVWGRGGVGLDYSGQPMSFYMGEAGETVGDPYEMVLNRGAAGYTDAPFTVSELERILRYDDVDAYSLPDRLLNAAGNSLRGNTPIVRRNRRRVTTHSSHVPVITGMIPQNKRDDFAGAGLLGTGSHSILELYALRLQQGGVAAAQIEGEMLKIVPWDIWRGQRFNINRLLGNGRDDNGNNVVDEPLEADGGEIVWPDVPGDPGMPGGYDGGTTPVAFNYLNDDPGGLIRNRYAPQIYARHLYCLMMLWTELVGPGAYLHPSEEDLPVVARRELTAQRIAQWAINVVDFKDADAIMTPFEYDVNPFDGWLAMDGDPGSVDGGVGSDRRLVWGAEYPDLLLTETKAFHDRRVKDTAYDRAGEGTRQPQSAATPGDDDLDQYRIPQGSLYLELYCARNHATNNTRFPRELYDENGLLDLGRLAPADPSSGIRFPVWHVVISEPLNDAASPDSPLERSQRGGATGKPDSTSFNPVEQINPVTGMVDATYSYNMDLVSSLLGLPAAAADRINPERYVWFTPQPPPAAGAGMATFFCRNFALDGNPGNNLPRESFVKLAPGSYAVVGPRLFTRVGASDDGDATTYWDPSPQRILMGGNSFGMIDNDGNDRYTPLLGSIRNPVGIICGALPPTTWSDPTTTAPTGIGLNVSEPLPNDPTVPYYEEPTYTFDTVAGVPDGYGDPAAPANTYPDEPFDNATGAPLAENNMQHTGTTRDYKAAFLQRLANPLEPYHVASNPYITVDWATIDLTVFNGEDDRNASGFTPGADPFDPYDDPDNDNADNEIRFSTRQRGGNAVFAPNPVPNPYEPFVVTTPDYQLWSPQSQEPFETQEIPNPVVDAESGNSLTHYFQHNLFHSLGYLNRTMGMPMPPAIAAAAPMYQGAPQQPFPWLVWNNRPMANPAELMQVPASTPSRLLHEFDFFRPGSPGDDPYDAEPYVATTPSDPDDLGQFRGTFRHLLNFFHSSKTDPPTSNNKGANFYRLLDYVETPSPFVGAEKWYNPLVTATDPNAIFFRPPYNYLSRFQDPGRVNINTLFDAPVWESATRIWEARVWEGIAKGFPAFDPTTGPAGSQEMFRRILESRRGYAVSNPMLPWDPFELDSDYPTLFGNPFRSADSADLMPDVIPQYAPLPPGPPASRAVRYPNLRKIEPVQATLLREDLLTPTARNNRTQPVLVPDPNAYVEAAYQNQDRNSYFRYHGLARLSNLVGNNSNVFAVWITVGYFEVEPNPWGVGVAHPDGFRLGPELGTDSGQITRHRGFYIIDRSTPVAFEPGQNHNVDNAILLRRFIE